MPSHARLSMHKQTRFVPISMYVYIKLFENWNQLIFVYVASLCACACFWLLVVHQTLLMYVLMRSWEEQKLCQPSNFCRLLKNISRRPRKSCMRCSYIVLMWHICCAIFHECNVSTKNYMKLKHFCVISMQFSYLILFGRSSPDHTCIGF